MKMAAVLEDVRGFLDAMTYREVYPRLVLLRRAIIRH
jgi:hypothetical protein